MPEERAPQNVIHERGLAAAGHARDAGEAADRERRRHVLEIVLGCARHRQPAVTRLRGARLDAFFRNGDPRATRQVIRRRRIFRIQDFRDRSLRDDLAAARPGPGTEIENVVRRANRFLIVLDHDDGISQVAEPAQGRQEPRVVALMQPDAGLIEHIKNAGQPRADLRRQPDALRFPTGKRAAFPVERKIIEPDFDQKLQPRIDLAHDLRDDVPLLLVQLKSPDIFRRGVDRQLAELMNIQLAPVGILDRDRQNFRLQPRAVAGLAGHARHERPDPIPRKLALRLLVKPLHLRHEPFERPGCLRRFAIAARADLDRLVPGSVIKRLLEVLRQIGERECSHRPRNASPARFASSGNRPASASSRAARA